ncbi:hypothetical protein G5S34_04305 [Herbaspirillum frisingense]|uniref:hypothetical protein n=1 Tax=Herbaspirillum frisingense TaxID=92645 RepID=UPI0015FF3DC7|nr:hypothetical protein [Herbaspirillum frisingense]QNB06073.1 hypothetical protein G5S34_04305 [Herbaspirillum frisingense]
MKQLFATAALALLSLNSFAANSVGQCVFPKYEIQKNGNMKLKKAIPIYSAADVKSASSLLTKLDGFKVINQANGLVQLAEVPGADGSNPNAGKSIGWAKLSDFDFQELRNCN